MKNYTLLFLIMVLLCSAKVYSLPHLNSYPSASATIYLDFDGQTVVSAGWNGGMPLFCAAAPLNDAQVTEIFNRVSEDYRPFDINITTDSLKFLASPLTKRMRVIVTPTSYWRTGVGGVSYIGSFTWGDDTPAFVFTDRLGPNNAKYVAECCTHESGHTLGLSHQSSYDANCVLTETYNTGVGSGETGWAPVMGNSYYKNMTGWNDGPTPYGCANVQDNLTIITSQNGFTYRPDDYTETVSSSAYSLGSSSFSVDGLISTNTDKDAFRFILNANGSFHMDATPFSLGNNVGANLDIKISLYNASQTLIRTYDPSADMSVTIDTVLERGTYYFLLDGTGNLNTDNYGSLGSYRITGFLSPLTIHNVSLAGNTDQAKHILNWNINADEPVKSQTIEWSEDGNIFKALTTPATISKSFSYIPYNENTLYYRLKVTSVLNQTVYSNVVALKSVGKNNHPFMVSTLVQNDITVNAEENYQYRLLDANGRLIATGNGSRGFNKINLNSLASGLYIIQLYNNTQKQTERIIKQ